MLALRIKIACGQVARGHLIHRVAAVALTLPAFTGVTPVYAEQSASFQWKASWIAAKPDVPKNVPPKDKSVAKLPIFRREFRLDKLPVKANLRISGLGHYEAHLNGRNVTDAVLTPGWTAYSKRVFYNTYDVTRFLHTGPNAVGILLGNGMYNVEETPGRYTKFTHSFGQPKLIFQLDLAFADGTNQTIASDAKWKTSPGPIVLSSTYGGEDYDARLEQTGWDKPGFLDASWTPAIAVQGPGGALVPESIPPVKLFTPYQAVKITRPAPGVAVYDLGQNFAGWPEIAVTGQRGARVKLLAGELLDPSGRVTQRSANAFPGSENSFTYTLKGSGIERWTPRFSYYGFRYVEVQTSGGIIRVVHLQGRPIHYAAKQVGHFTSSDPLINSIHLLIDRAMLSNMVSILTDCPHREKLGWLEQTHLAGASLMYNYDLSPLYRKMADDIEDSQLYSGLVPSIAPEYPVFEGAFRDSPEWGAAVILSAWTEYQFSGDPAILRDHFDSMRRYLAYLHGQLQGGLLTYGLGDWYDVGPYEPGESKLTTKGLTATAIYFQMLTTTSRIATLLGHEDDAARYLEESHSVQKCFNARFFHQDTGSYDTGSQTANAMPLAIGLVPEASRTAVLANLVDDIRKHSNHVTAGDVGFHYVVRALTDNGRSDVLYDMLSRADEPSYGDQLAHGATTLTEAWDANPNSSQNHFMLGHAEEWFYRGLAGIDFDRSREPDARIRLEPAVVGHIHSASAIFQSSLGLIQSVWVRTGNTVQWTVIIPKGANATVVFPIDRPEAIRMNGNRLKTGGATPSFFDKRGKISHVISGGRYRFDIALIPTPAATQPP